MPIFLYDTCHPYDNLPSFDLYIMLVVLFSCACSQTNLLQQTGLKLPVVLTVVAACVDCCTVILQSIMKLLLNVLKPLKTGDTQHTSCGPPCHINLFYYSVGPGLTAEKKMTFI